MGPTKSQKRRLRELSGLAWERELSSALAQLEESFSRWRAGELDAFEFNELIHRHHDGVARDLWKFYTNASLEGAVGQAVAAGILGTDEVDADLLPLLQRLIAFYRDELSRPDGGEQEVASQ